MSKYNARATTIDGIRFASKAEARRYTELKLLQEAGEIDGLELQPSFIIWSTNNYKTGKTDRITYIADFKYFQNGQYIVEDVKGVLTPVYRMKKKMFLAGYPHIKFIEVKDA